MRKANPTAFSLRIIQGIFSLLVLSACGGGSGGDGSDAVIAVARNSTFTTAENTPGVGYFNVTIPTGRTPVYTIVTNGTLGTAVVSDHVAGEFTYTPNPDAAGPDTFTFRVNDGVGDSNLAAVSVTITADPDTPVAASDTVTTTEDTPVTINVLANDPTGNGSPDPATVSVVSGSQHGSVIVNSNGSVTYTPDADYNGSDSFTYNFRDTAGHLSSTATVDITVTPVNDAPVARDDMFTVLEDSTTDLPVLDDNSNGADFDVDGDTLTIVSVGAPDSGGTTSINNSQDRITYTPTANFFGTESFTYTISDGNGATSTATAIITVTNVNDAPVAENDAFTIEPNTSNNTLPVLANNGNGADWDIENDPLTITAVGTPSQGGSVGINVNKDALVYTPPANFTGTETFTYTISDGNGGSDNAMVTVNIAFMDDFSSGIGNWTRIEDSGLSASWVVTSGKLRQQNRVENSPGALDQSYHKGTYAYYSAGTTLTDYRFSAEATFLGTGLADDIGVMFRYQDRDNYYRVSMNSRYGFTRFEKKIGGDFTPLAVDARGYRPGQVVTFTIDVNGSIILVYVNGDPLFAINDSSLASGSVALYTQDRASFDDVSIQGPSTAPSVILERPVAATVTPGDTLAVSAIATNVPDGGKVEFLLDGTPVTSDASAPYSATFTNAAKGDHTVAAVLRDAGNIELARDTNILVGAQGDYYVAVGDSITNGGGDNYASDNYSIDNQPTRIVAFQGYQANLLALLENSLSNPVATYNEGVGGDESVDAAFSRIDSILVRHPDSNKMLVLLGTNDALAQIPVGSGCSGAACDGTFRGNMQSLIDTITAAGKTVHVALVPPVFGLNLNSPFPNPNTANSNVNYVQRYNSVITSELSGHQLGPDLYAYFLGGGQNRFSLFADVWHPNALGHTVIAALWHNVLNPADPVALPFVLDNLTRSTSSPYIKQNLLEIGDTYYIADATDKLVTIPETLANGRWIMTPKSEWDNADTNYITFDVDRAVTVYIAYDAGASTLPNWMSGYTNTWQNVQTTDSLSPELRLYSRSYSAGTVTLGGNLATGANGADSNYVAIVVAD